MNIKWNEYTWYSRSAALLFFILILPLWTFYLGRQYQQTRSAIENYTYVDSHSIIKNEAVATSSAIQYKNEIHYKKEISLPYITNYSNKNIQDKVNSELDTLASTLGCETDGLHSDWNTVSKVMYVSDDIYSISIHSSYFCGGAYPTNDDNESLTFDMKTGNKVAFKDLFTNYEKDKKEITNLIFEKQIKEAIVDKNEETSCADVYASERVEGFDYIDYLSDLSYFIGKGGITVQADLPHAIAVCADEVFVPISKLTPYFNSSSILSRVQ